MHSPETLTSSPTHLLTQSCLQTHYNGPVHLHLAAQYPELKERGETILKVVATYLNAFILITKK